jgi:hypothetical protein
VNVQITNVIVHEPAQAREILREALAIASELSDESVTHDSVFNAAVQLLGQRYTFAATPTQAMLPLSLAPNGMSLR